MNASEMQVKKKHENNWANETSLNDFWKKSKKIP